MGSREDLRRLGGALDRAGVDGLHIGGGQAPCGRLGLPASGLGQMHAGAAARQDLTRLDRDRMAHEHEPRE